MNKTGFPAQEGGDTMISQKKLQLEYCCLQGFYWMLYCVAIGYLNSYLTGVGLRPGAVGIITATCGVLATLVQPVLGKLADRDQRYGWKIQLQVSLLLCLGCYFVLKLCKDPMVSGLVSGVILLLLYVMMPFVSGAGFYYEKMGITINFGTARGFGSLFYSVASYLLGFWVADFGVGCISTAGILVVLCFFVTATVMPYQTTGAAFQAEEQAEGKPNRDKEKTLDFFKEYPRFTGMLVGFVFLMVFHAMTNTYMLQIVENVGGGTAEMGVVLALAGFLELPVMFAFSWLVKKVSSYRLLLLAGIGFAGKSILYITATTVFMIYAAQLLQIISYALFAAVSVYYANEVMDEKNKLRGQALVGSSITIGAVLGNLLGGALAQGFGIQMTLIAGVAAAVMGTVVILLMKQPAQIKKDRKST